MSDKLPITRRLKGMMLKRMHSMITCLEFENFIQNYLDDTLPIKQRKLFEWHMRLCKECRDYLAAYKRAIELGQATLGSANDPVPSDVPEDLIQAILDASKL
jgi:anti-sigma factor RsiW